MANSRINEIDLLRFIAALAVVFFHYTFRGYAADSMSIVPFPLLAPYSKYGYLGVELFFMISGFVILMTASCGSMRKFVISRFIRLYPAFWISCTITFILILAIGEPRYTATWSQYLINMTMTNEFFGVQSIDDTYWSLFIEIQFYAFICIALFFKKISKIQIYLTLWLIISIVLQIFPNKLLNFLLIVNFSAYFIAGATYYLIWLEGISLIRVGILIFSWGLALFQLINSLEGFEDKYNTSMNSFVVAGIMTFFFIGMLFVALKLTGPLGKKQWILAGGLTYPLYLLHANIGFMIFNLFYPSINRYLLLGITFGGVLLLVYMIHTFFEKRFASYLKAYINNKIDSLYSMNLK
jgi:peptidoglycan/LPS O-acetylase OafA/YrhL